MSNGSVAVTISGKLTEDEVKAAVKHGATSGKSAVVRLRGNASLIKSALDLVDGSSNVSATVFLRGK